MRRRQFLNEFLMALGAKQIHWKSETDTSISGVVFYEVNDPEEYQEFIWHAKESESPSAEVTNLAQLIKEHSLLSIDKIKVSRCDLRKLYSKKIGRIVSESEFLVYLETLFSIEVSMVDEGSETDVYFIHE
ncbi:hypothetical protein [Microbulbifer taiwanensis]|uniref:Uncharacterized protein n=1 Tax=Microbulbifer taiwanensis TaxID=986746 RepID=A0ABW1YII1_9GAMM|nr:hypothetical protein [Microbulbifer taiwanensis]